MPSDDDKYKVESLIPMDSGTGTSSTGTSSSAPMGGNARLEHVGEASQTNMDVRGHRQRSFGVFGLFGRSSTGSRPGQSDPFLLILFIAVLCIYAAIQHYTEESATSKKRPEKIKPVFTEKSRYIIPKKSKTDVIRSLDDVTTQNQKKRKNSTQER